ncbi:MAG: phosphatase PAP2 family protein [Chlorobi bacterium]|nr:phosphatase PAP2 family protein [Chlorobiota bacterium]
MKTLAKLISYLFIPPLNLLLIFIYLSFRVYDDSTLQIQTIAVAAIFGFILPLLVFFYLRWKGEIIDNEASVGSERTTPYLIGIGLSVLGAMLSMLLELHPFIVALWLSYVLTSVILVLINKRWKISAHAIGVAIPFAVLVFTLGNSAFYFAIILIIVSWSRMYQNLHDLYQVVAGLLVGYLVTYYLMNLSLNLV